MKEEYVDLAALKAAVHKRIEEQNHAPVEELDNLSPLDLHALLYAPFSEDSPLIIRTDVPAEVWKDVSFFELTRVYLKLIREAPKGEIQLTKKGQLPVKLVRRLYDLKLVREWHIDAGIQKLYKQSDSIVITNLFLITGLAGLTKKRLGKLSLTKKGDELLEPGRETELFQAVFLTYARKFNLGYHDRYVDDHFVQLTLGFDLYLLLRYGKERRSFQFYVDKNVRAFPTIPELFDTTHYQSPIETFHNCLWTRNFSRFLNFFGFIETYGTEQEVAIIKRKIELSTTPAFRSVFALDQTRFAFRRPGASA